MIIPFHVCCFPYKVVTNQFVLNMVSMDITYLQISNINLCHDKIISENCFCPLLSF